MSERNTHISMYFHVHLVSDSTGETLVGMMKASTAQFRNATALEHLHTLVRSEEQLEKTLCDVENKPGIVLYTLVNADRRRRLEEFLRAAKYSGDIDFGSNFINAWAVSWYVDDI